MAKQRESSINRRRFLHLTLVAPPVLLAACSDSDPEARSPTSTAEPETQGGPAAPTAVSRLEPTPECGDDDDLTPAQTEGPYFTPNSPERASLLEPGISGTRLVVAGAVLSTSCQPVARALVDFWQCDDRGDYDNVGYHLRGHQFTDANGRYRLETIVPGLYPGRTRHIHVKAQAPNRPVLPTQLYFPDEPGNRSDRIFNPDLVMEVRDAASGKEAVFNFVLNV
jgi:protocatechuate 3,4-dioxygenase beta subunit